MKPSAGDTNRWRWTFEAAAGAITLCLICVPTVGGQTPSAPRVPMAEEVFKNIQVLKGIPVDQFMGTMGIFAAALGKTARSATASRAAATGRSTPRTRR